MNKTNNNSAYLKSINWKILGINENATEKEIKDAYARLAEMFHPDKIKETKGREANYLEKQTWNEILDAYTKALKEADNKKGEKEKANKDEEKKAQNKNDINKEKEDDNQSEVFYVPESELGKCCCYNGEKQEELTSEEKSKIWKELEAAFYREKTANSKDDSGNWTREKDIIYFYLGKKGRLTDFSSLNKKTKQLAYHWRFLEHHIFCSRNHQEREEFFRRTVEKYKEILEEISRAALADEESVRAVDEMRKSRSCIGCHLENKDTNTNNKQSALTFNEEREEINNTQTNQNSAENEKPSTITDQEEINNTQTNQNSAENNVISSEKKDEKVDNHLDGKKISAAKNKTQKSLKNDNQKINHLISIGLPIGIIFVLVVSSVFWIVKRKRFKKEKN